jgi:hypothetical protein
MSDKLPKLDIAIWHKLAMFAELTQSKSWNQAAAELGLPMSEARRLMVALQEVQHDLEVHTGESEDVFHVWNWKEWCQLTHLLEDLVMREGVADLRPAIVPLLKQIRQHPAYPVYVHLRQKGLELSGEPELSLVGEDQPTQHKIALIEEALLAKETLIVECSSGKQWSLIPCKLTFLEGALTLIAEETHDHGLISLQLLEMRDIKRSDKVKSPRAGIHEVADFIRALRSMAETETRLVLKIKHPDQFVLMPDYQFLGKPALITNPDGDIIWAAWVEPSDELFEWLTTMDEHVEILEPGEFVLDYAAYCEEKLRKMA